MTQSPLTRTLYRFLQRAIPAGCVVVAGCATVTPHSLQLAARRAAPAAQSRDFATSQNDRVAAVDEAFALKAARPFAWQTQGTTKAGNPLRTVQTGREGFRVLVVGSIGGHDPLAVQLTEEAARYLHNNSILTGGLQATFLQTLNPDGRKLRQRTNADNIYLNRQFPAAGTLPSAYALKQLPDELQFLIRQVEQQQPQRIIHIRTVPGNHGVLAVSSDARKTTDEVASWLNFRTRQLPGDAQPHTLENWVARRQDCDMITIGIPRETRAEDLWILYGDAVISLLMDGDSESRRLAREQSRHRSANRNWSEQADESGSIDEMFRDDRAQLPRPQHR